MVEVRQKDATEQAIEHELWQSNLEIFLTLKWRNIKRPDSREIQVTIPLYEGTLGAQTKEPDAQ